MIHIGTSGYGYHDWMPEFYPTGLPYDEWLGYYTERFSACELSFTAYRMPAAAELGRLVEQSDRKLVFTVKAHRRLTHERENDLGLARHFAAALDPLYQSGRLGAVLAQFPFSFLNHPEYRAYVCRLRAALGRIPMVAEFRHPSWFAEETLDFLRGWGIGLVAVDGPDLPSFAGPHAVSTSEVGYVRFHGRNADAWWRRDAPLRYDYRYSRRQLLGWLPRLREIERSAPVVFVYFNNTWRGQAAANALELASIVSHSRTASTERRRIRRNLARAG